MTINQELYKRLKEHPVFINFKPDVIVNEFKKKDLPEAEKIEFIVNYLKNNSEKCSIESSINFSRFYETSKNLNLFNEDKDKVKEELISLLKETYPWNRFINESHQLETQAYTTAKLLYSMGKNEAYSENYEKAIEFLKEQLELYCKNKEYSFLILLITDALFHLEELNNETLEKIVEWGDLILYKFESQINRKKVFNQSVIYVSYILVLITIIKPNYLEKSRINNILNLIINNYKILPEESKNSITRINNHAVGCSSFDVLKRFLKSDSLKAELFQRPDYLLSLLDWLHENSYQTTKDIKLFKTDVFSNEDAIDFWYNCTVIEFLELLQEEIESYERDFTIKYLNGYFPETKLDYDNNLIIGGYEWPNKLKSEFLDKAKVLIPKGEKIEQNGIILFGPPGTSKTTTAELIAKYLGKDWPIINLSPGIFLTKGPDRIFERIEEIFKILTTLKKVVILFDEFELLVLERDNKKEDLSSWSTGIITDIMLPWFKALHDFGGNIYIIATNDLNKIDSAIRRPNRFDFVLPVGPPDNDEQKKLLSTKIKIENFDINIIINEINKEATIGELGQWAREVSVANLNENDAKELWINHYKNNPLINEEQFKNFEEQKIKHSFPPSIIGKNS